MPGHTGGHVDAFGNDVARPCRDLGFDLPQGRLVHVAYCEVDALTGGDEDDRTASGRVVPGTIQFIEVGTILKVTPRINDEDNVLLEIEAEDSTAEDRTIVAAGLPSAVPEKVESKTTTQATVGDSQTIVLGGPSSVNFEDDVERVPVLGELPFVGRFFRKTQKNHRDRELFIFIFITCTNVDEFTHPEAERLADFDESAADKMRHSQKSIFKRAHAKLTEGDNEISVSIGQGGEMHSDGKIVGMEDLRALFNEQTLGPKRQVIVRTHPRAPKEIETEVVELAMEADLNVEFDEARLPFVPVYREEQ